MSQIKKTSPLKKNVEFSFPIFFQPYLQYLLSTVYGYNFVARIPAGAASLQIRSALYNNIAYTSIEVIEADLNKCWDRRSVTSRL